MFDPLAKPCRRTAMEQENPWSKGCFLYAYNRFVKRNRAHYAGGHDCFRWQSNRRQRSVDLDDIIHTGGLLG